MVLKEKLEAKIHRAEKKFKELTLHTQRLSREYEKFLDELDLTPEQLKSFNDNPENFSEKIRDKVQLEKKKIGERLNLELNNVHNPKNTEKTFSERGSIKQHWLFVR